MLSQAQKDAVLDLYDATQAASWAWEQQKEAEATAKPGGAYYTEPCYVAAMEAVADMAGACKDVGIDKGTIYQMLTRYLPREVAKRLDLQMAA